MSELKSTGTSTVDKGSSRYSTRIYRETYVTVVMCHELTNSGIQICTSTVDMHVYCR